MAVRNKNSKKNKRKKPKNGIKTDQDNYQKQHKQETSSGVAS